MMTTRRPEERELVKGEGSYGGKDGGKGKGERRRGIKGGGDTRYDDGRTDGLALYDTTNSITCPAYLPLCLLLCSPSLCLIVLTSVFPPSWRYAALPVRRPPGGVAGRRGGAGGTSVLLLSVPFLLFSRVPSLLFLLVPSRRPRTHPRLPPAAFLSFFLSFFIRLFFFLFSFFFSFVWSEERDGVSGAAAAEDVCALRDREGDEDGAGWMAA
ncbi:hypothetical protein GGS23DRAFT_207050 [Durotheca rogersii]|uniref:uncharacterized protein n=1 Tax=Durotheca rogersii TaxID=419775 RepID=UPI002220DD0C|nr:uncharacterized protein GGS23DRAFT_207050 [Durotheca rogersii]KAI5861053.1 hypothetical protein GGS23DRAFT_207050 [Durotheca rogersii]